MYKKLLSVAYQSSSHLALKENTQSHSILLHSFYFCSAPLFNMTSPSTQNLAAICERGGDPVKIEHRPIPTPGEHQVLVRNRAVAANPADWKVQTHGYWIPKLPAVLGSDLAGVVDAVGPAVTRVKPGDRVLGFACVMTTGDADRGAWQTYTIVDDFVTVPIPDALSFEEAAVFPMGIATAATSLFVQLGVSRPPTKPDPKQGLLVWGGASSIGMCMIQIARDVGLKTVVTASAKHHEYLKSLGATALVDYREPDAVDKVVAAAQGAGITLSMGFDCVAEPETVAPAAQAIIKSVGGGGKESTLINAMPWPESVPQPSGITVLTSMVWHTVTDMQDFGEWLFTDWLAGKLAKGELVPAPKPRVVPGGIGAAQQVYDTLKAGVSGEKLVVQVA